MHFDAINTGTGNEAIIRTRVAVLLGATGVTSLLAGAGALLALLQDVVPDQVSKATKYEVGSVSGTREVEAASLTRLVFHPSLQPQAVSVAR